MVESTSVTGIANKKIYQKLRERQVTDASINTVFGGLKNKLSAESLKKDKKNNLTNSAEASIKLLRILNNQNGDEQIPKTNITDLSVDVLKDWAELMGDTTASQKTKKDLLSYITTTYDFILKAPKNEGTKTETSMDTELTMSKVQANKNDLLDSIAQINQDAESQATNMTKRNQQMQGSITTQQQPGTQTARSDENKKTTNIEFSTFTDAIQQDIQGFGQSQAQQPLQPVQTITQPPNQQKSGWFSYGIPNAVGNAFKTMLGTGDVEESKSGNKSNFITPITSPTSSQKRAIMEQQQQQQEQMYEQPATRPRSTTMSQNAKRKVDSQIDNLMSEDPESVKSDKTQGGKSVNQLLKTKDVSKDIRKAVEFVYEKSKNLDTQRIILNDIKKLTAAELTKKYGKYVNVYKAKQRKDQEDLALLKSLRRQFLREQLVKKTK